jgi:hypothetical protein
MRFMLHDKGLKKIHYSNQGKRNLYRVFVARPEGNRQVGAQEMMRRTR